MEKNASELESVFSALDEILSYFEEKEGIPREQMLSGFRKAGPMVPASVFRELPGLSAVVKYLKENLGLENREIAKVLSRSSKTIWSSYRDAFAIRKEKMKPAPSLMIPAGVFGNRKFSMLENAATFLKKTGLRNNRISEILGKDQRTIWTILKRAEEKENARQ